MHIYFSGIGGAGIGPLAMVAHQAGYEVSGSDKQDSSYINYLKKHGISNIHIGQSEESINKVHESNPIDWFVYTSALPLENPNAPELIYCRQNNIKISKRDELLNVILDHKKLKLVAIAGTHGKTTTVAMTVWLLTQLGKPISYLLPAKTSFAKMGNYNPNSEYFVYEADEFDRNFLAYNPAYSLISGVSWDHHEIFLTREDYQDAFRQFISQSDKTYIWGSDNAYLALSPEQNINVIDDKGPKLNDIKLVGKYSRMDALLACLTVSQITGEDIDKLINIVNKFPGLSRRMEMIRPNLFSDYAHTPEKIRGAMSVASEMANANKQDLVVIYEPLTNRRQHYMLDEYKDCFKGANKVYWLPSYLAREDPSQKILDPSELISHLSDPSIAMASKRDEELIDLIERHLSNGDMVVGMAGGGGNSLDDWLREEFAS